MSDYEKLKLPETSKDHPLIGCEDSCLCGYLTSAFIEDFRKAMKGE